MNYLVERKREYYCPLLIALYFRHDFKLKEEAINDILPLTAFLFSIFKILFFQYGKNAEPITSTFEIDLSLVPKNCSMERMFPNGFLNENHQNGVVVYYVLVHLTRRIDPNIETFFDEQPYIDVIKHFIFVASTRPDGFRPEINFETKKLHYIEKTCEILENEINEMITKLETGLNKKSMEEE